MIWKIVWIALASYAGLVVYMYVRQSGYVYFPLREIEATPREVGLRYEDVTLTAGDGVRLSAWFVPADNTRGTVLLCHGNGGNISHRLDTLTLLHALGFDTLIFDYRGYGRSEGSPSEQGTYLDAEAAWEYLTAGRGVDPSSTVVFGRSLGGAVAAQLASTHTPGALIVESSFTSVPDMAAEYYPFLPARAICRIRYRTVEHIARVACPVLVVHSPQDDIVPFHHGRRLFDAAPEPKEFLEITGSHNDGFLISGGRYERGLEAFLSGHVSRQDAPDGVWD